MKEIYISWKFVQDAVDLLTFKIHKNRIAFDGIYAIPRGGLVPGVMLSHTLKLPFLVSPTKDCLLVDDISDTGNTLKGIKHKKIACIYTSLWTKVKPDFWSNVKDKKDSWIFFPWENEWK